MKYLLTVLCLVSVFYAFGKESQRTTNASPDAVILDDFKLTGDLTGDQAAFSLTATARVESPKGGSLELLSGRIALTEIGPHPRWHLNAESNRFVLNFDRNGKYPIQLKFNAEVREREGWKSVGFRVAPSALQPVILQGLPADTRFDFPGAARPEHRDNIFASFLPPDGLVKLSWNQAPSETEGKLFYSAEMLSQINVRPGLMGQTALLNFKVMQGELKRVTLLLNGAGEVTRVQGDQVLAWSVEPASGPTDRRLIVQFNQPQKDQFALHVQMQTPLGAFPQLAEAVRLAPEGATRFAGYFRIVNEGAVRLEVVQASGLSQISPEQFPESEATRAALRGGGSQRFAYRLSGPEFVLRLQADQIVPELSVSELLAYHLAENELAIDAEFEVEIREAPLRELVLLVPKGYAIARLTAQGMSDYFLRERENEPQAELRLVYAQPATGRQLVQLRLEKNQSLGETVWTLPRLEVSKAKSIRGYIAASADAGFRLIPERTQALTEIATAFFPRKISGIQGAFRLSDSSWAAALRVERLPQSVHADVLHLFCIGEGIAYGSSVMNYLVSGAPIQTFKVELPEDYFNIEFAGKDIRNWQKLPDGYLVQLHTPVSGAFTLLASYERPFKSQGETLAFTGARALDAQSEQGHAIVISAYQFQVKTNNVSPGLLPLETGEVPAEYRLFFDAPILAAYRYTARPFSLKLSLSPLAQGDSLSQIVDRASFTTHISKEGQVLTEAHYFVKNRGHPYFRLTLPSGNELWSAVVNGSSVVPVSEANANLIPLPQRTDPNAVLTIDLQLAARSSNPTQVRVAAPIASAPMMLAEWKLEPDAGQRLEFRRGSLTPVGGVLDASGFAGLMRTFGGDAAGRAWVLLLVGLFLVIGVLALWRWGASVGARYGPRHLLGLLLGLIGVLMVAIIWYHLGQLVSDQRIERPRDAAFLAPIQQAGSALSIDVSNLPDRTSVANVLGYAWPVLLGLLFWLFALLDGTASLKMIARTLGWLLIAWAALRTPNGAAAFLVLMALYLLSEAILPAFMRASQLPRQPQPARPTEGEGGATAAAALIILFAAISGQCDAVHALGLPMTAPQNALAESVAQDIRVEDKFAFATARLHWLADKGQVLPLLFEPAVMTRLVYPSNALELVATARPCRGHQLIARKAGTFDIVVQYQLQVAQKADESGLTLPVCYGLINRLSLTVHNLDVEVLSPQAVSVQRELSGSNTLAELVLSPATDPWVAWKPLSRDVKHEKAVFYAELSQLYVPSAGVIEGVHYVSIRPAQGELNELIFTVPPEATITDVLDARPAAQVDPRNLNNAAATVSLISLWRFDPEMRELRVTLKPSQSRSFALVVRSQVPAEPLPFEKSLGLLRVEGAAGQIGLVGVATGNEVQLDGVQANDFSPINLEDFPAELPAMLQTRIPGLTVRRAFRYGGVGLASNSTTTLEGGALTVATRGRRPDPAPLTVRASVVEPDIRVETQDTLSLGEDRTVLAVNATVEINRAGIFRLSFLLPGGFDVESISGSALSHWTELKSEAGRVITLHLPGRTEGKQQFTISLAGQGAKATNTWSVPQLMIREANKQRGTLLVVPEQGLRLQVANREGVTQLDPLKSGIRQKGVLAFRILQTPWNLALGIEQFEPWIQVNSLQHATITEAQAGVTANLQYQIENTGSKLFHVLIPTNAENVRFQGDQVSDSLPVNNVSTNGLREWEVKLHRRVLGPYLLQATFQLPIPQQATELTLQGVQAAGVNLQRGFVTIQSAGRLQVSADRVPESLQPAEWQSIPPALKLDLQTAAANFAYRLVEPSFVLPLTLGRHEAARLLPARVNSITFDSVIADDGVMLTHARLEMSPGDKRLLYLTLPPNAQFWFAFVNQNGVWPWREKDQLLIPLEQQPRGGKALPVEFFYSSRVGSSDSHALDLQLLAPKFDLPLENITWRVSLSDKWQIKHWSGSLQLQQDEIISQAAAIDLQTYLQSETTQQRERTKEAEELMAAGNSALGQGNPLQARRAFQSAYGLSTHDAAFNEDARVQLHNIKLQEALVGLNMRQASTLGDPAALGEKFRDLRAHKEINYTQQDAKDMIDRNSADDNAAFMRLAERLIQQQDAAVSSPAALKATIPEQGRVLTFKRAVLVDRQADLQIDLSVFAAQTTGWTQRGFILGATLLGLAGFGVGARKLQKV